MTELATYSFFAGPDNAQSDLPHTENILPGGD